MRFFDDTPFSVLLSRGASSVHAQKVLASKLCLQHWDLGFRVWGLGFRGLGSKRQMEHWIL